VKLKTQIVSNTAMKTSNLDIRVCTYITLRLWTLVTCNTREGTSHLKFAWNVSQVQVT